MAQLFNKLKLGDLTKVSIRYKHGPDHWSVLKKKKTAKDKALEHFDDFYGSVYGDTWKNIRAALLKKESKYIAVVNNFSDSERIRTEIELLGAINLKSFYNVYKQNIDCSTSKTVQSQNVQNSMETYLSNAQLSEVQSIYPTDHQHLPETLESEENEEFLTTEKPPPVKLQSIEKDLNEIEIETNRIIDSSMKISMLQEYVPATKLKGLNDWVLESDYYKYYNKKTDFEVDIVPESILSFPEHLHAYAFESGNTTRFPPPKKGSTNVLDYYLFDGGSLLPLLALDIQQGDIVLDMCAAPGGKALTIYQTLLPHILVANDVTAARVKRITNVKDQYICTKDNTFFVTKNDARVIDDKDIYNKILVDVPCTVDRHVLHSDENNLFKASRFNERIKLPELQSEILKHALKLIRVGGTVVYATCSLSPVQNDGVVHVALKDAWNESDSIMIVKDMSEVLSPLKYIYKFADIGLKYGHIVVPSVRSNWGPIYFCKIVRIK